MKETRPPAYSFGAKPAILSRTVSPAPNTYTLPAMTGSGVVGKASSASYSITGRSKIGSFHEDLKKVSQQAFCYNTSDDRAQVQWRRLAVIELAISSINFLIFSATMSVWFDSNCEVSYSQTGACVCDSATFKPESKVATSITDDYRWL